MLHTFIDGIALSAAVIADSTHRPGAWPAGMGVFLAILLHKPLDALSITSLMQAGGWSRRMQQLVNGGFALMCPLGAWAFLAFADRMAEHPHQLVGTALAISAGVFLCISLSDLLPEVQFHRHDRLKLSATLVLGVLVAYGMRYLEPAHLHHEHGGESATHVSGEDPHEEAHH
jgi:zinc and cadmium transporter